MKKLQLTVIVLVVVLGSLTVIGLAQGYTNQIGYGCEKYDASEDFYGYECGNKPTYYVEK